MGLISKIFNRKNPQEEMSDKFTEIEKNFGGDEEMMNNTKGAWLVSRGNHYGKKKKYKEAIKDFKEAIRLKADYIPAYLSLAIAYKEMGNVEKAMQIIKNAPKEMKLHGKLVITKEKAMQGMIEEAM